MVWWINYSHFQLYDHPPGGGGGGGGKGGGSPPGSEDKLFSTLIFWTVPSVCADVTLLLKNEKATTKIT